MSAHPARASHAENISLPDCTCRCMTLTSVVRIFCGQLARLGAWFAHFPICSKHMSEPSCEVSVDLIDWSEESIVSK